MQKNLEQKIIGIFFLLSNFFFPIVEEKNFETSDFIFLDYHSSRWKEFSFPRKIENIWLSSESEYINCYYTHIQIHIVSLLHIQVIIFLWGLNITNKEGIKCIFYWTKMIYQRLTYLKTKKQKLYSLIHLFMQLQLV